MRVLLVIALTCAILAVASAMPFMENVHQFDQIPVRAFSSMGSSDLTALLAGLSGASSTASSGDTVATSSGLPALVTAISTALGAFSTNLSG